LPSIVYIKFSSTFSTNPKGVEQKVDLVLYLLQGNPIDKDDNGLIGLVNNMDSRIKKLEKLRNKILWVLVGIALPGGVGVAKILGAIAEVIHK